MVNGGWWMVVVWEQGRSPESEGKAEMKRRELGNGDRKCEDVT